MAFLLVRLPIEAAIPLGGQIYEPLVMLTASFSAMVGTYITFRVVKPAYERIVGSLEYAKGWFRWSFVICVAVMLFALGSLYTFFSKPSP